MNGSAQEGMKRTEALVLVNSASRLYTDFECYIQPYLDHFGVPYRPHDLASAPLPTDAERYALIIVGHGELDVTGAHLDGAAQQRLVAAVRRGSGLVNFDGVLATPSGQPRYGYIQEVFGFTYQGGPPVAVTSIEIQRGGLSTAITVRHPAGESLPLFGGMSLPHLRPSDGVDILATGEGHPLLLATLCGKGRAVQWTSTAWAHTSVRGPLFGLDDLVWRGLAWAACKPFVMRGLPPLVTMRVDDVSGWGLKAGPSPLWWVSTACRYGFKPWLGLFIGELSWQAIEELKGYIAAGQATASVHSFTWYNFFYYDHWNRRPFSDALLADHFRQAEAWYTRHGDFPRSKVVLGHFYELGANGLERLARWGAEFLGTVMDVGAPYDPPEGTPWLVAGPYRKHEEPRPANETRWPLYYADFLPVPSCPSYGRRFFNVLTEIRDNAGYEWAPDNDVAGTVERGVTQLRRALDSMALATLFTHESDYIHRIRPENWEAALAGVTAGIARDDPLYVTLDEACRYLRALRTSRVEASRWDPQTQRLSITLVGQADVPTRIGLFLDEELSPSWIEVPAFEGRVTVEYTLD